jgi:hypothetical protein
MYFIQKQVGGFELSNIVGERQTVSSNEVIEVLLDAHEIDFSSYFEEGSSIENINSKSILSCNIRNDTSNNLIIKSYNEHDKVMLISYEKKVNVKSNQTITISAKGISFIRIKVFEQKTCVLTTNANHQMQYRIRLSQGITSNINYC